MDLLEKNERFWQRIFEGLFRRGAAVTLQPVEIAKKLVKTMNARRTVSVTRVYVPNIYLIYLHPADFEPLTAFEHSLAQELADYLRRRAVEQNLTMVGEPRVEFEIEEELAPGEMRIHARLEEEPVAEENAGETASEDTLVYETEGPEAAPPEAPAFRLVVVAGPDAGRTFLLGPGKQVLGRRTECDFILTDDQVSRRHFQVERNHDRVMLTDLGSRNGTLVNGKRVEKAFLRPGDRLQAGRTVLELQVS